MKKPKIYNITPAKGQAILSYQGRTYPDKVELFETELVEEVRQNGKKQLQIKDKQKKLNSDFRNLLIHGDCLSACAYLKSKNIKVDLVYIDPPFASGANYAKKIYLRNGNKTKFESEDGSIGEEIMYGDIWQKEDYLNWLYGRLLAIREVMSEEASIYVHLDWHIGHYVKLLLDEVFGESNFKNEIVWHYRTGNLADKLFQRKHDVIFFYSKGEEWDFKPQEIKEYYFCLYGAKFKPSFEGRKASKDEYGEYRISQLDDVWDISQVFTLSDEHVDYTTQKPKALLRRIIGASSKEGAIVADFFSGSGTTAKVAGESKRKFIVCDIGANAVQTTRDELSKQGEEFDILKVRDGVRLFRNPVQTTARLFSLIEGFKPRAELELSDFWDGGIVEEKGSYIPIKFIGIDKKLTKELLDVILEEIYKLEDTGGTSETKIIYAFKDSGIDQSYVNKSIKQSGKTTIKVELVSLDDLLEQKRDSLFAPDNADVEIKKENGKFKVQIKKYFSPYLKAKIDEFNSKKVKKGQQQELKGKENTNKIKISDNGLELIEAIQFDTKLRKDGVWESNLNLEDKAGIKEKIKGVYFFDKGKFKMKIRNIAGDEITIDKTNEHKQ